MTTQEARDRFSSILFPMRVEVRDSEQYKKLLGMLIDMGCSWCSGNKEWDIAGEYNRYVYVSKGRDISKGNLKYFFDEHPRLLKTYKEVKGLYKELTSEEGKVLLKQNTWYKSKDSEKETLFFYTGEYIATDSLLGKTKGFGINAMGEWRGEGFAFGFTRPTEFREATKEEVISMLTAEAKRRGLFEGAYIKAPWLREDNGYVSLTPISGYVRYSFLFERDSYGDIYEFNVEDKDNIYTLMKDGVWAEAVSAKEEEPMKGETWYKSLKPDSKTLFFYKGDDVNPEDIIGEFDGYGFDYGGEWHSDCFDLAGSKAKEFVPVAEEEVLSRLTEEAKRRGLVEGVHITSKLLDGISIYPIGGDYYIDSLGAFSVRGSTDYTLLCDGEWASPVTDMEEEDEESEEYDPMEVLKSLLKVMGIEEEEDEGTEEDKDFFNPFDYYRVVVAGSQISLQDQKAHPRVSEGEVVRFITDDKDVIDSIVTSRGHNCIYPHHALFVADGNLHLFGTRSFKILKESFEKIEK